MLPKDFLHNIIKRREVPFSNFFAYLLNPKASHNLGAKFFETIFEKVIMSQDVISHENFDPDNIVKSIQRGDFEIDIEDQVDGFNSERIDILIHSGNTIGVNERWAFIIEMKIDHSFNNDVSKYWYSVDWVEESQKTGLVISPQSIYMNTSRFYNLTFARLIDELKDIAEFDDNIIINCIVDYMSLILNIENNSNSPSDQYKKFCYKYNLRRTSGTLSDKTTTHFFYGERNNLNDVFIRYGINIAEIENGTKVIKISPSIRPKKYPRLAHIAVHLFENHQFRIVEREFEGSLFDALSEIYEQEFHGKELGFSADLLKPLISEIPNIVQNICSDVTVDVIENSKRWFLYKEGFKEFLGIDLISNEDYSFTMSFLCDSRYKRYINDQMKENEYLNQLVKENGFFIVEGKYQKDYNAYDYEGVDGNIEYKEVLQRNFMISSDFISEQNHYSDVIKKITTFMYKVIMNYHDDFLYKGKVFNKVDDDDYDTIYANL